MTSPKAEGLFHRAIVQSAPATSVYGPERGAAVAARFLELVGVDREDVGELLEMHFSRLVTAGGHPLLRDSDHSAWDTGAFAKSSTETSCPAIRSRPSRKVCRTEFR